jgi:murein L,D-transpeptidase YcbB/YkuD
MNARSRRKLEMGARALKFSREHPDASPGYAAALSRLEELLKRAEQLASQQRDGIILSRSSTQRKKELRKRLKAAHLDHLARVARVAAAEAPELPQKFEFPRSTSYLAFRTAARGMEAEALAHKELMVKRGLAETILQSLSQALDQFDAAMEQGSQSRIAHVGASFELDEVAEEVVQVVQVMDGVNRHGFAGDGELLASWEAASNVVATPRAEPKPKAEPVTPVEGGVRPAA